MKAIKRLIDLIRLYNFEKNALNKIKNPKVFLDNVFKYKGNYKRSPKGSHRRNLVASTIKQIRAQYPYQPIDYSKAKKMYDEYFKMPNHIPSFEHIFNQVKNGEEVYVVNFRSEAPVKGKRFNEYHINSSGTTGRIYHLKDITEKPTYSYINMHSPKGYANVCGISEDFFTNFRYATKDEIADFKMFSSKIKRVEKLLKEKQKVVSDLYTELAQYEKCQF